MTSREFEPLPTYIPLNSSSPAISLPSNSPPAVTQTTRSSFGDDDKLPPSTLPGSKANSPGLAKRDVSVAVAATTSSPSRVSVSQRVREMQLANTPIIRALQLGSPLLRPYPQNSGREEDGASPMPPPAASPRENNSPQRTPLHTRRSSGPSPMSSPLGSPIHAFAFNSAAHAGTPSASPTSSQATFFSSRRSTAPASFVTLPSAPVMTHAQTAISSSQILQYAEQQQLTQKHGIRTESATLTSLLPASTAEGERSALLPSCSSSLGGRSSTAMVPPVLVQPNHPAQLATQASSASHLKPQHVPICCAAHGALQFLATLPPPPSYTDCPKLLLVPEKKNQIPKLPAWALIPVTTSPPNSSAIDLSGRHHSVVVQPSSNIDRSKFQSVRRSVGSLPAGVEISSPSIQAWIAEAEAATVTARIQMAARFPAMASSSSNAAVNLAAVSTSTPNSAVLSSVSSTSDPCSSPQSTRFAGFSAGFTRAESQRNAANAGSASITAANAATNAMKSSLSVNVQGHTPTPPPPARQLSDQEQANNSAAAVSSSGIHPSLSSPSPSPITGCSSGSPPLVPTALPPPAHRHQASFHTQTPPFGPLRYTQLSSPHMSSPSTASASPAQHYSPQTQQSPQSWSSLPNRSPLMSPSGLAGVPPSWLQLETATPRAVANIQSFPAVPPAAVGSAVAAASSAGGGASPSQIQPLLVSSESSSPPVLSMGGRLSAARGFGDQSSSSPHAGYAPVANRSPSPVPPAIPTYTPRARAVSATVISMAQSPSQMAHHAHAHSVGQTNSSPLPPARSHSSAAAAGLSSPPVPNSALPPPLPPYVPRPGSSGSMRAHSASAPSTPLSPTRDIKRDSHRPAPLQPSLPPMSPHSSASDALSTSPSLSPSPSPTPAVAAVAPCSTTNTSTPTTATSIPPSVTSPPRPSAAAAAALRTQLASLQRELSEAISQQRFEICIGMRDQIKSIEDILTRGS